MRNKKRYEKTSVPLVKKAVCFCGVLLAVVLLVLLVLLPLVVGTVVLLVPVAPTSAGGTA